MMNTVIDMPQAAAKRPRMERLVFNGIVFNMSWEDPEMDRRAFNVQPDDVVLSITSAGCNPLNLLCQNPRRLIAIDSNPAQNALMELKLAAIATLDHEAFFDIFAARRPTRVTQVYRTRLRPQLSERSRRFWDKRLWMVARGVYHFGRMGIFCQLLRFYLKTMFPWRVIDEFMDCRTLDEQAHWYQSRIAPRIWGPATRGMLNFRPFLYLAGVHPQQFDLVDERHDIYEYVKERIDHVMTRVPIYNNYFLSMAVTGRFRGEHVPPYLLASNFPVLVQNLDRVQVVNGWLGPFLDSQPAGSIHKFNLLDIFDWMSDDAFESTLKSVLRAAAPGARFIYRSGSYRLDPPPSIRAHVSPHTELARELLAMDRSATYGSFYVYTVNGSTARVRADEARSPVAAGVGARD